MVFTFVASLWRWKGESPWHFITVPFEVADDIDDATPLKAGFGSIPVTVTVGETTWSTSLFPSKEMESYILPMKKEVRASEQLSPGDDVSVRLELGTRNG
jgi:hypothetical protein